MVKGKGRVEALSVRSMAYERSKDWEHASLGAADPGSYFFRLFLLSCAVLRSYS